MPYYAINLPEVPPIGTPLSLVKRNAPSALLELTAVVHYSMANGPNLFRYLLWTERNADNPRRAATGLRERSVYLATALPRSPMVDNDRWVGGSALSRSGAWVGSYPPCMRPPIGRQDVSGLNLSPNAKLYAGTRFDVGHGFSIRLVGTSTYIDRRGAHSLLHFVDENDFKWWAHRAGPHIKAAQLRYRFQIAEPIPPAYDAPINPLPLAP